MRYVPSAIALGLCILAIYALYFRQPGGRLAAHDAYSLRTFANFYVTVPAVLAALLGYLLYARAAFWRDPALFATAAIFTVFVFYKIRIVPEHFWAARRFLPVILPVTLLFACAAGLGSTAGGRARLVRGALGIILVSLLGWHYMWASAPVAAHVEYAGLIPHLERLASQFGNDDLVIVEGRDAQSDVHVMATPLAYVYGRNVLVLNSARPDKAVFATFLEWAKTRYRRVLFVGGGGTDLLSHRYAIKAVSSTRFQVPEYESSLNAYPRVNQAQGVRIQRLRIRGTGGVDTGGALVRSRHRRQRRCARPSVSCEGSCGRAYIPLEPTHVLCVRHDDVAKQP